MSQSSDNYDLTPVQSENINHGDDIPNVKVTVASMFLEHVMLAPTRTPTSALCSLQLNALSLRYLHDSLSHFTQVSNPTELPPWKMKSLHPILPLSPLTSVLFCIYITYRVTIYLLYHLFHPQHDLYYITVGRFLLFVFFQCLTPATRIVLAHN